MRAAWSKQFLPHHLLPATYRNPAPAIPRPRTYLQGPGDVRVLPPPGQRDGLIVGAAPLEAGVERSVGPVDVVPQPILGIQTPGVLRELGQQPTEVLELRVLQHNSQL